MEEKGGVESLVTAVLLSSADIVMMDIAGVELLEGSGDMPEDLSTKQRTVSVQTETCNQERFEQIFDGFSHKQIRYFMDILIHFASKKGNGNFMNELETFYKNIKNAIFR